MKPLTMRFERRSKSWRTKKGRAPGGAAFLCGRVERGG